MAVYMFVEGVGLCRQGLCFAVDAPTPEQAFDIAQLVSTGALSPAVPGQANELSPELCLKLEALRLKIHEVLDQNELLVEENRRLQEENARLRGARTRSPFDDLDFGKLFASTKGPGLF